MLVGSLSGRPVSVLLAGPIAKLIAEQLGEGGDLAQKRREMTPAGARGESTPARPYAPPLFPPVDTPSSGPGLSAVVAAYGEL